MTKEEKKALRKAFADIPGTRIYTPEMGRLGYELNMFCMSLNKPENREAFRENEAAYLDKFKIKPEQKEAVLNRNWIKLLDLGGNIYYTWKIAACDKKSMQYIGGKMSGITEDEFREMMLSGGRSIIGNRSKTENQI